MAPPAGAAGARLLWLLRHAKTVPDPPPGGTDHERPLAPRGRRDADALARRLGPGGDRLGLPAGTLPQLVLCSSATRTAQTAERVLAEVDQAPPVTHLRSLYAATPEGVLDELRMVDDEVGAAMVVGHNPTMHDLVAGLPAADDLAGRRLLEERGVPTCTVAVLLLPPDEPWSAVAEGTARLVNLSIPPF